MLTRTGFNTSSYLAFQNPDLIFRFRLRADTYAKALLRSEHPQGLVLMARMFSVGDVYPQDRLMAYAYAVNGYPNPRIDGGVHGTKPTGVGAFRGF